MDEVLLNWPELRARLAQSRFRSRFRLSESDRALIAREGWETIAGHSRKIVRERLAPAAPRNDGRQTPMRGHPVFVAQHATATCCRGCLETWWKFPKGIPIPPERQARLVDFLMAWIKREYASFRCQRCGACCRIPNGIVRVSDAEIARIAAFLDMTEAEFIDRETLLAPDRRGLVLRSRPDGACVWLTDDNLCRIHPVKPDKCRTFPHKWTNPDSHEICPAMRDPWRAPPNVCHTQN
jgi:Fe-S-cluster containining protein